MIFINQNFTVTKALLSFGMFTAMLLILSLYNGLALALKPAMILVKLFLFSIGLQPLAYYYRTIIDGIGKQIVMYLAFVLLLGLVASHSCTAARLFSFS